MLKIKEAIVVEGRYDKNTLSQLVDALIIPTDGFAIFQDKEKTALLRRLARKQGLIVLTDSDGAGFLIRNHLKRLLPPEQLKQAYIPDRYGKERRKRKPGKEGKLGVEGMPPQILEQALRQAGATFLSEDASPAAAGRPITKLDLFQDGLTGAPDSARRRAALQAALDLPQRLTTNGLLEVLNQLYDYDRYRAALDQIEM